MKYILALLAFGASLSASVDGAAASRARAIQTAGLDPDHCYRVSDLNFQKEDVKMYLTDGHLMFLRPVEGRRLAAVFVADTPGGDAEVIVLPPISSERRSLAQFTGSPNLNEHFKGAVFLFSDNTGQELLDRLKDARKDPEAGLLVSQQLDPVVKNIAASYEIRLIYDLFKSDWERSGLFIAAIMGKTLGNFDVLADPRSREAILLGRLAFREERQYFDTWTSFPSRSLRNGNRKPNEPSYVVQSVKIDATLNPDLSIKATSSYQITAKTHTDPVLSFDLSRRMKVTEVRFDGQPVEVFVRESMRSNLVRSMENDAFLVILPKSLEAGETHTVEIVHDGAVIASSGNGVYYVGARANWYPSQEGLFAKYDLTFRYPKTLQLISSGDIVEDKTENDIRITRRKIDAPIRFLGFNLGNYEKASEKRGDFTIDVYANRRIEEALQQRPRETLPAPVNPRPGRPPRPDLLSIPLSQPTPDPKLRLRALASEIGDAVEFMNANFGPPPLKALVVSPIPGTFGQGFPGLLYLSTLAYLDPNDLPIRVRTDSQKRFFSELLHAHETAHQWWGNLVIPGSYQDDWLMEALASYSAMLFLEKKKGRRAMEEVLDEYRNHLLFVGEDGKTTESAGPIVLGSRLNSSQTSHAWRAILYEKGAWIIHMIRVRLGDAAFYRMLTALAQRNRYQRVTTEDFRRLSAEFLPSGSDDPKLESFFEQWVYGTGIPSLRLTQSARGKAPKVKLQGSVTQSNVPEDFSIAVPVEIALPGKRSMVKWVRTSDEAASFTSELAQAPVRVMIDPYSTLMRR